VQKQAGADTSRAGQPGASVPRGAVNADSTLANNGLPADSTAADTLRNPDDLENTVEYTAEDSTIMDAVLKQVHLYGNAEVNYGTINLKANYIRLNWVTNEVYAVGTYDSTAKKMAGEPIFQDGPETYNTKEIRYNFKSKKALIQGIVTQEGDGNIRGEKVKKDTEGNFYIRHSIYTTCNLTHPHYFINAPKIKKIETELDKLKSALPSGIAMGRAVQAAAFKTDSRLYARGDFRRPGPVVNPAVPRVAGSVPVERTSPQSRIVLAEWIASPDNALAARVIVNRVWLHHFGRGLSENANDFGTMGAAPTHPELLDWLASDFLASGGSLKALHRRIVTSAVYRTSGRAGADPAAWNALLKSDPDNRLLGHMPRRRLDGEEIRDAMLEAAGTLNDERFGPGVRPPLPPEVVSTLLKNQWNVTPEKSSHTRRSAYLFVRRNLRFPLFEVFDRPDANQSCPRRHESTTAPQALTLLNSEFTWTCAASLAETIQKVAQTPAAETNAACQIVLTRAAAATDIELRDRAGDLTTYCAALLNASEFLYVD